MEFKETFAREKLQGLAEERRLLNLTTFINNHVAPHVLSAATIGKTSFLYERTTVGGRDAPTDEELINGLKIKFPGSSVTLSEEWVDEPPRRMGAPLTRVLKKGIKIDWS